MWLIPDLQSRVATSHARLRNRQTDFLQFCISLVPAVGNKMFAWRQVGKGTLGTWHNWAKSVHLFSDAVNIEKCVLI